MKCDVTHRCLTGSEDSVPLQSGTLSESLAMRLRYIGQLASLLTTVRAQPDRTFGRRRVLNMLEKSEDYDIAEWLVNEVESRLGTTSSENADSGRLLKG